MGLPAHNKTIKEGTIAVTNDIDNRVGGLLEDSDFIVNNMKGSCQEIATEIENILPDLVITCVGKTGKFGVTLCRELKKRRGTRMIPIIFISRDNNFVEEKAAFVYGCLDYLDQDEEDINKKISRYIKLGKVEKSLKRLRDRYEDDIYFGHKV